MKPYRADENRIIKNHILVEDSESRPVFHEYYFLSFFSDINS